MGYLRSTSYCPKRISLFDLTHLMSMVDCVAIDVETLRIDSGCFVANEFTKLISINPSMVLCQIINLVDSCHGCIHRPLT